MEVDTPGSHGPCSQSVSDGPQKNFAGRMNAHLTGFSQQFASETDAFLLVQGEQFPVHRAFLTYASTVFCGLFEAAQAENLAAGEIKDGKICVTMAGHTIGDTSIALSFLYQRVLGSMTPAPSKQLWQSVDQARPAIEFAHKFDMRCILDEADTCLSEAASTLHGDQMFDSMDAIVAWANLAHGCCLKKLLSEVELVVLKSHSTDIWRSPVACQFPQACQLRVLRAAQQDRAALEADLKCGCNRTWGVKHVNSSTLLSWQECGSNT